MLRTDRARRLDILVAALLAAVALVAFSPGLFGPFLWDDLALIPNNPAVRSLAAFRDWFTRDFWDVVPDAAQQVQRLRYYRPLVTASYALDWQLGSGSPLAFHITNSVAHAVAVVLVYVTLRRWTAAALGAAVGAAYFALHPARAESVAWIAGRTDVLCTLAMLVAVLGAGRRLRGQRFGLLIELVATAVAYLTKEGAVVLPVLIAAEQWAADGRPELTRAVARRLLVAAVPQLVVALAYLSLRAVVMPIRSARPPVGLVDHAQFCLESIGRYVSLTLGAHELSSQHALLRTLDGRFVHHAGYVAFGALSLAGLVAAAIGLRKRVPGAALGIAMFLALLAPVSNLVLTALGTLIAERFLYAPHVAVALVVASLVERAVAHRRLVVAIASGLLMAAFARATIRAVDFSDDVRFWARERALHPESLDAHRFTIASARGRHRYRTALRYAREAEVEAARYHRHAGAELEFVVEAVELNALLTPDRAKEQLAAMDAFFASLLDPRAASAEVSVGGAPVRVDLVGPIRARALALRARVLTARGILQSRLGAEERALPMFDEVLAGCPGCELAAMSGALSAARAGDYPRARAYCDRVAALRGEGVVAERRNAIESAFVAARQAAVATGPVALNLRASELAKLEAWGRAYEVLAPYREQIELAPGFAIGFAELAFRAGETEVARGVLEKRVPAEKVAPTMEQWARKMGWVE